MFKFTRAKPNVEVAYFGVVRLWFTVIPIDLSTSRGVFDASNSAV